MSIRIENRIGVAASTETVWGIIADLERWGDWNPLHPQASGRIAIGGKLDLVETLEGEPERRFEVRVPDWTPEAQLIWVERPAFLVRTTRYFELEALGETATLLANGQILDGLRARDWVVPRRARLAAAFEAINEAIKFRAESV